MKLCVVFVGNAPKEASFSMHSLLVSHYLPGAWYPKGGASQIAYNMIPIIEKAGGAVLVRAPVNRILLNGANEAIGNIENIQSCSQISIVQLIAARNQGFCKP